MANRRSLALRRTDTNAPLRPDTGYDSALRSDFSYIPEDLDPPEAILQVRDVTHTTVEVAFDPLSIPVDPNFGAPTEIALVRSPSGYPTTILDGNMVRRHPPEAPENGGWVFVPDSGLTPGTWYYYGLFAKYESEGNTHWLRIGERSVLMPAEYLSADHLFERIPEWYRRADMEPGDQPGLLRRVIDVIGYQTDAHRTWAFTIGDVWDAEKISADLLPYLGDTLGQPVEYAAGDERYRALLSRIIPLRKLKGTEHGTEAYLSSITGYRTRVYSGLNLLPTVNEAEARYTVGLWQPTGNAALTRVLATGTPAGSPAAGRYYHRLTYNGTIAQRPAFRLGTGSDLTQMVPVPEGHQIVLSAFYRSSFTGAWTVRYRWFDASGALLGTNTATIGTIGTTWGRQVAPAVTTPAGTAFAELNLELSVDTTIDGLVVEATDILVADLAWRPEDVPGSANTPPLSTTNPGEYDDVGYYEPPRTVHVNVYPQRINYALNSEFTLDNIPADAWTVAERATWGLLKEAYSDWGDIIDVEPGDSEDSWGDLAEGFEPLAGTWSIYFDTDYDTVNGHGRLVLTPGAGPDFIAQVQSHFVPVVAGDAISAAFIAWATVPGVEIMFSVEFFTDDAPQAVLTIDGAKQTVHGKGWTMSADPYRYELRNVTIPEGATYARVVVGTHGSPLVTTPEIDPETGLPTGVDITTGTGVYTAYLGQALIENAPVPGPYFNGNEVDSAYGDYFFLGMPHESYSVYYQNYRSFINEPLGEDRITSLMDELLPMETHFVIRTASGGLY
jgi:Phage tail protein (Tail_P2_I)